MKPARVAYLLGFAALVFACSWLFHQQVLQGVPHIEDELNYLWQSQVFARLQLSAPRPPLEHLFIVTFQMVNGNQLYSVFPPGWPALLAIGQWLGIQYQLPMGLAALESLALWALARRLTAHDDRPFARWIPWLLPPLCLISPAFIMMSATYMAHTACLLLVTVIWWAWLKLEAGHGLKWSALVGLCLGLLLTIRPVDAVAVSIPLLVAAGLALQRRTLRPSHLVPGALLTTLGLTLLLAYNQAQTGHPLVFPQDLFFTRAPDGKPGQAKVADMTADPTGVPFRFSPDCNKLGLGPEIGCGHTWGGFGHTPLKAATNAWVNLQAFDRNLLGGYGAFLLVLPGLWMLRRVLRSFSLLLLLFPGLYSLYWYHGTAYGARFIYPLMALALLGVATSLAWLGSLLHLRFKTSPAFASGLLLFAILAIGSGYRAALMEELSMGYWCVDNRPQTVIAPLIREKALVLLGYGGSIGQDYSLSTYPGHGFQCRHLMRVSSGLLHNDPFLENQVLYGYAPDSPLELDQIRAAFPDRKLLLYMDDATTGSEQLRDLSTPERTVIWEQRSAPSPAR